MTTVDADEENPTPVVGSMKTLKTDCADGFDWTVGRPLALYSILLSSTSKTSSPDIVGNGKRIVTKMYFLWDVTLRVQTSKNVFSMGRKATVAKAVSSAPLALSKLNLLSVW